MKDKKKSDFDKFVEAAKTLTNVIRSDKESYKAQVIAKKTQQPKTLNEKTNSLFNKEKMDEFFNKIKNLKKT